MSIAHRTWQEWEDFFMQRSRRSLPALEQDRDYSALPDSLARSLAIFQLGESGGGTIVAQSFCNSLPGLNNHFGTSMAYFVEEEHRHANILAICVRLLGGTLIRSNWTAHLFVFARRLIGLQRKSSAFAITTCWPCACRRHGFAINCSRLWKMSAHTCISIVIFCARRPGRVGENGYLSWFGGPLWRALRSWSRSTTGMPSGTSILASGRSWLAGEATVDLPKCWWCRIPPGIASTQEKYRRIAVFSGR